MASGVSSTAPRRQLDSAYKGVHKMRRVLFDLPPRPRLRGRGAELATLAAAL